MSNSKVNILVVDDHPDNLRTLSAVLSEQGYRVRKATNGEMALSTIQIETPDLILLDVLMPQMNGYELCTILKADPHFCEIPIIFLSALSDTADKVDAFAVGGADYITKPFQSDEVLARIKHQLTIRQQQQSLNEKNQQLQQEIQERRQAQIETQLLLTTIQAINQAFDLQTAFQSILGQVCKTIAWDYGEVWLAKDDQDYFQLIQACYHSTDEPLAHFHTTSAQLTSIPGADFLVSGWPSCRPEWISDLSQGPHPEFLRTDLAIAAGLQSAFAVPIVWKGQRLAVLIFFRRSLTPYDANLMQLVNAIALQLGALMQRKQAEEALRQANQELRRLVNLDGLTQIANRRFFDETLHSEWQRLKREQSPLALILCDVDYFKPYNDHYGHQAGDECLKQIAQAIDRVIRRPADLAARYGGEEFAIILPNTEMDGAAHVAEQIQAAIASLNLPHAYSHVSSVITVSMGIAGLVPTPEIAPDDLVMAADQALYTAKAMGRNRYCLRRTCSRALMPDEHLCL